MTGDHRNPDLLGQALFAERGRDPRKKMSEIADLIDRGLLGEEFVHPVFLNGRSAERISQKVGRGGDQP